MNAERILDENSIFRIGRVVEVRGRTVSILVDKAKNSSHLLYRGELLESIAVGGYVRIAKGFTGIVGKVEGEQVTEDRGSVGRTYSSEKERVRRVLTVSLLGFFREKRFERGIKELPLIDNECFLLRRSEFRQVHNFVGPDEEQISIGTLSFERGHPIALGVNSLFASHIGIFGNTGSGKSYTLAKLYCELLKKYVGNQHFRARARFLIVDFNGEYVNANHPDIIVSHQFKKVYSLSTGSAGGDKFPLSLDTLSDADFWITFLEATEKTQTPFLRRALASAYLAGQVATIGTFRNLVASFVFSMTSQGERSIDKAMVINFLKELRGALDDNESLAELIEDYEANLQFHTQQNAFFYSPGAGQQRIFSNQEAFKTDVIEQKVAVLEIDLAAVGPIDRIRLVILLQYYDDCVKGFSNRDHLAPLIKRLDRRIDDLKKVITIGTPAEPQRNVTIVGLKDVNLHMRKILPFLLCKKAYNDKKAANDPDTYLNIIVDEAHNVLSESSQRESEQWRDHRLETFEEIIKEGRKFGVFLTIASQRPADISPTIISQLHTYFLHRLINVEDINMIRQTVSYLDRVSFESLPILPTGTCVLAGLLANIPVVLDIAPIRPTSHEPYNKTIVLTEKWM